MLGILKDKGISTMWLYCSHRCFISTLISQHIHLCFPNTWLMVVLMIDFAFVSVCTRPSGRWRVCVCVCVCVHALSHIQLFATPGTVACQAPLSIEFSRQEYWSGLPFPIPIPMPIPIPGIFLTQRLNPHLSSLLHLHHEIFATLLRLTVTVRLVYFPQW